MASNPDTKRLGHATSGTPLRSEPSSRSPIVDADAAAVQTNGDSVKKLDDDELVVVDIQAKGNNVAAVDAAANGGQAPESAARLPRTTGGRALELHLEHWDPGQRKPQGSFDPRDDEERIVHHQSERQKAVNYPVTFLSWLAHHNFGNAYVNTAWLIFFSIVLPIAFTIVWYGIIPLGNPFGHQGSKAVWVFLINPGTMTFLSYLIITMFFGVLDSDYPWRPVASYCIILLVCYGVQVLLPGLVVYFQHPFTMTGLVAVWLAVIVTALGLRFSPHKRFDCNKDHFMFNLRHFGKVLTTFCIFSCVLMAYIVMQSKVHSGAQGVLTAVLQILGFIFKKILLAQTDMFPLEMAMVIAGLWIENLVDVFIVLAYPTVHKPGITFFIIWLSSVLSNCAYLVFQTDMWFKFRIWIKGKFKKSERQGVEIDISADDRGHSNQHPGYRRRQLRFLTWKLFSQCNAAIFFLCVAPVLRYHVNKHIYPYEDEFPAYIQDNVHARHNTLSENQFRNAMIYAALSLLYVLVSWMLIYWYMMKNHRQTMVDMYTTYRYLIVSDQYFGFILTVLVSNALLAVLSVQAYARIYYY